MAGERAASHERPSPPEPSDDAIRAALGYLPGRAVATNHEWWQCANALKAAYAVDFLRAGAALNAEGKCVCDYKWLDPECCAKGCQSLVFNGGSAGAATEAARRLLEMHDHDATSTDPDDNHDAEEWRDTWIALRAALASAPPPERPSPPLIAIGDIAPGWPYAVWVKGGTPYACHEADGGDCMSFQQTVALLNRLIEERRAGAALPPEPTEPEFAHFLPFTADGLKQAKEVLLDAKECCDECHQGVSEVIRPYLSLRGAARPGAADPEVLPIIAGLEELARQDGYNGLQGETCRKAARLLCAALSRGAAEPRCATIREVRAAIPTEFWGQRLDVGGRQRPL